MQCIVSRPDCRFRTKKAECQVSGCFEITSECHTAKLDTDPCERIVKFEGKEYCSVYFKPPWINKKKCPLAVTKIMVEQEKKINPLKASKKAAKGQGKAPKK
jgi:hypothetical protein